MTKYLDDQAFSVHLGSAAYRDNFDAIFGKKTSEPISPVQARTTLFQEIEAERRAQDAKWGGAGHDDEHPPAEWESFIKDHLHQATRGIMTPGLYRKQLVRVAALAVAALEVYDRKEAKKGSP